ncbi:RlmE family RNA methyltransferase [Yunchengibacter salinarum]|uniref:RlmE family RNA methyltransferase n=1 Tax=Yunchengibacter salinarum TaxID=3133399 RepID=UPI0035B67660
MSRTWNRNSTRSRSRGGKVRVKTARGRKASSTRWLQRQLNDPYVAEAKRLGYRSRAAFKVSELDDKYNLFRKARTIVDLGAAPGGWCQVARERTPDGARILGIDLLEMEPMDGVDLVQMDFMEPDADARIRDMLNGPVDLVLSDMANAATGHRQTDHLRTVALAEAALDFALMVLSPGGAFVAKVLQGGSDDSLLGTLKTRFAQVRHAKPPASRADSKEWFVVALDFKG